MINYCGVPKNVRISDILKEVTLWQLIRRKFNDEVGENETDDRSHDLTAVRARLFLLQLNVLQEESFELTVLFINVLRLLLFNFLVFIHFF